jgi:hypothetical protein
MPTSLERQLAQLGDYNGSGDRDISANTMVPRRSRSQSTGASGQPDQKKKRAATIRKKKPAPNPLPKRKPEAKPKVQPKAKSGSIKKAERSSARGEESEEADEEVESSEEETEEEKEAKRKKLEREQKKLGSYVGDGGRYYTLTEDQRSHRTHRVLQQGNLGYALESGLSNIAHVMGGSRDGKRRVIQSTRNIDLDILRPAYQQPYHHKKKKNTKKENKKENPPKVFKCTLNSAQAAVRASKALVKAVERAGQSVTYAAFQRVVRRRLVAAWLIWCYDAKATHAKYTIGDLVEVRFQRKQRFFAARVIAVQRNGAAFSVRYAGGEEERQVRADVMRSLPANATACRALRVPSAEESKQANSSICWQPSLAHKLLEVTRDGQRYVPKPKSRELAVSSGGGPSPKKQGGGIPPFHDLLKASTSLAMATAEPVQKGLQSLTAFFSSKPSPSSSGNGKGKEKVEGTPPSNDEGAEVDVVKTPSKRSLACCHWCGKLDGTAAGGGAGSSSNHSVSSTGLYTAAKTMPFTMSPVAWSSEAAGCSSEKATNRGLLIGRTVLLCAACQLQQLWVAHRFNRSVSQKRAADEALGGRGNAPLQLPSPDRCMPLSLFVRSHYRSRKEAGALEVDANGKIKQRGLVVDKDGGMKNGEKGYNYGMPNHRRCGEMLPPLVAAVACCVLRMGAGMLAAQAEKDEHAIPMLSVIELGSGLGNVASQLALQLGSFASVDGVELRGPIVAMADQYLRELKGYISTVRKRCTSTHSGGQSGAVWGMGAIELEGDCMLLEEEEEEEGESKSAPRKKQKKIEGGSSSKTSRCSTVGGSKKSGKKGGKKGGEMGRVESGAGPSDANPPPYVTGLERLQFLERDLFHMDMSGADFVVANNFGFGDEMNDKLLTKLHQDLRVGAVVVTLRELLPAWANDNRRRAFRLQRDRKVGTGERREGEGEA